MIRTISKPTPPGALEDAPCRGRTSAKVQSRRKETKRNEVTKRNKNTEKIKN